MVAPRVVPPIVLSPMRADHLDQVIAIERLSYSSPWTRGAFAAELSNAAAFYLIATLDDALIGYGGSWSVIDETHITTVAVHPDFRGNRYGEAILHAMLDAGKRHGMERATLEVRASNQAAIALYQKYGFVDVGARPNYYKEPVEDGLIMWLEGLASPRYELRLKELRKGLNYVAPWD